MCPSTVVMANGEKERERERESTSTSLGPLQRALGACTLPPVLPPPPWTYSCILEHPLATSVHSIERGVGGVWGGVGGGGGRGEAGKKAEKGEANHQPPGPPTLPRSEEGAEGGHHTPQGEGDKGVRLSPRGPNLIVKHPVK